MDIPRCEEMIINYILSDMKDKIQIKNNTQKYNKKEIVTLRLLLDDRDIDTPLTVTNYIESDKIPNVKERILVLEYTYGIDNNVGFFEAFGTSENKVISTYYSRKAFANIQSLIWENENKKVTVIADSVPYYLIASTCASFRAIKDIFVKQPLTPEEVEWLKQLSNQDQTGYENAILKFIKKNDVESKQLYKDVYDWFTQDNQERLEKIEGMIDSCNNSMGNARAQIAKFNEQIKIYQAQIVSLNAEYNSLVVSPDTRKQQANDIMDFLNENRNVISISSMDADALNFTIRINTYLDDYNYDSVEMAIDNGHSIMYTRSCVSSKPNAILKLFYKKLFLSGTYKIRSYSVWVMSGRSYSVTPAQQISFLKKAETMPNPHLGVHHCVGSWGTDLMKFAEQKDFISLVTTMILSSKAINVEESASFHYVIDWLFSEFKDKPIIQDIKNGNVVTPTELYEECRKEIENEK